MGRRQGLRGRRPDYTRLNKHQGLGTSQNLKKKTRLEAIHSIWCQCAEGVPRWNATRLHDLRVLVETRRGNGGEGGRTAETEGH